MGDQPANRAEKPAIVKQQQGQVCLKNLPKDVKNWLADGSADIGASIDCTVSAFEDFTRHVVGSKSATSYTEGELATFLKDYLVKKDSEYARDSREIMSEILKLKRLFIGGSDRAMTKAEFAKVSEVLLRLKPKAVALTPHIPLVFFGPENANAGKAKAAADAMADLIKTVSDELELAEGGRPTWTTRELLKSIRKLGFKNDIVQKYLPLVETAKSVLVGGDDRAILGTEWTAVLDNAAKVWSVALRLRYDVIERDDRLTTGFDPVEPLIGDVLNIIETGVRVGKASGGIPRANFETLIDQLAKVDALPLELTPSTLKDMLPILFGKILYGRSNPDWNDKARVFGPIQLARLRDVVNGWLNGHKAILARMRADEKAKTTDLAKDFADDDALLSFVLQYVRPLPHDDLNRLIVLPRSISPGVNRDDLILLNAVKSLVAVVLRGYPHDPEAAKSLIGLTESEANEVYFDIKTLGRELNLMDVRNQTAGARTFMEASIFTSTSDGSAYMSLNETVEWFHFVLGGGQLADKVHKGAVDAKCGRSDLKKDVLGKLKLDFKCFQVFFIKNFNSNFSNLPLMVKWMKVDKTGARYLSVVDGMMLAGRTRGLTTEPVDSSELRAMIPILHYAENLFSRHDTNSNDLLDDDELWRAFPILQPFIKKMGNGKADGERIQKAIFSWILKFGEPPTTDFIGSGKLLAWSIVQGAFKISANRADILKVMASFVTNARQARLASIAAFHKSEAEGLYDLLSRGDRETARKVTSLFQCQEPGIPVVRELLKANASKVAPKDPIAPEEFTRRVQKILWSDDRLEMYCLPF
ncbi:MAG TPA: hypothetical protein VM432_08825 [Bdellovibrionales bacterium]|nr:hypothetical protein [Bdellovibrionales bacterium]